MKLSDDYVLLHLMPEYVKEALSERGWDTVSGTLPPSTVLQEYLEWHGVIGYDSEIWGLIEATQEIDNKE